MSPCSTLSDAEIVLDSLCTSSDPANPSCSQAPAIQEAMWPPHLLTTTGCLRPFRNVDHISAWLPLRLLQQQAEGHWHSDSAQRDQKRLRLPSILCPPPESQAVLRHSGFTQPHGRDSA